MEGCSDSNSYLRERERERGEGSIEEAGRGERGVCVREGGKKGEGVEK